MNFSKYLMAVLVAVSMQSCVAGAPAYGQTAHDPIVIVASSKGHGTGTHLGNGLILTAAHVVAEEAAVMITHADGTVAPAAVLLADKRTDVAFLSSPTPPKTFLTLDCRVPAIGEHVEAIGHPTAFTYVHAWGRVASDLNGTAAAKEDFAEAIWVASAGGPGMSGGPVIADGKIVGIVNAGMVTKAHGFTGFMLVVPGKTICDVNNTKGPVR
jgi:S1-C subfamily serine protease